MKIIDIPGIPADCYEPVINRTESGEYEFSWAHETEFYLISGEKVYRLGHNANVISCNNVMYYRAALSSKGLLGAGFLKDSEPIQCLESVTHHCLMPVTSPKGVVLVTENYNQSPIFIGEGPITGSLPTLVYQSKHTHSKDRSPFQIEYGNYYDGEIMMETTRGDPAVYITNIGDRDPLSTDTKLVHLMGWADEFCFVGKGKAALTTQAINGFFVDFINTVDMSSYGFFKCQGGQCRKIICDGRGGAIIMTKDGIAMYPRNVEISTPKELGRPSDICLSCDGLVVSVMTANKVVEIDLE